MIRFWKRDSESEQSFLQSPDISICPKCGAFLEWHIWGTEEDYDLVKGIVCTHCGWLCGTAKLDDLLFALGHKWAMKFTRIFKRRLT